MHGHSQAHIFHQEDLRGPLVAMVIATFSIEKGEKHKIILFRTETNNKYTIKEKQSQKRLNK